MRLWASDPASCLLKASTTVFTACHPLQQRKSPEGEQKPSNFLTIWRAACSHPGRNVGIKTAGCVGLEDYLSIYIFSRSSAIVWDRQLAVTILIKRACYGLQGDVSEITIKDGLHVRNYYEILEGIGDVDFPFVGTLQIHTSKIRHWISLRNKKFKSGHDNSLLISQLISSNYNILQVGITAP